MKRKCACCGEIKDDKDFYWRDKAHTKKKSYCKKCDNLCAKHYMRVTRERKKNIKHKN